VELIVAALQLESRDGDLEGNLARAEPFIAQAAAAGARLVCLPELYPSGYVFDESLWKVAEPPEGPTVRWLGEQARRHGITVGTSFVESDGQTFRNAFVLVNADGVLGRIYKRTVAYYENYVTAPGASAHVISTPLGRIGVGICFENTRAFLSHELAEQDADLLLQPHSAPHLPTWAPAFARRIHERALTRAPVLYAQALGIPCVLSNKCGAFDSPRPEFPYGRFRSPFLARSRIVDSDARLVAAAGEGEQALVAKVTLAPERKTRRPVPSHGHWVVDAPGLALRHMDRVADRGARSLAHNPRVVTAAAAVLSEARRVERLTPAAR
jgi:N-carbamoylputrescine amidase